MSGHENKVNDVVITSWTKKGNGLGAAIDNDKRWIEVPFSAPGDTVRAQFHRKRHGVYKGRLEEVITPSPLRQVPKCKHFGVCGGCRWQHISYTEQLKIKQESVEALFAPLQDPDTKFFPIEPCPSPWNYRNKMEFSFSSDAKGEKFLGLIMDSSSGKVVNLEECHLVNPWFAELLNGIRDWWKESHLLAYYPPKNAGSLRTLTVREGMRTGDRLVMLTVSGNADYGLKQSDIGSFAQAVKASMPDFSGNLTIFVRIQQIAKGQETQFFEILVEGPDQIREILHITTEAGGPTKSLMFGIAPTSFFQPNTAQAERLYSLAIQHLGKIDGSVVYDLYCGTGTLGICVAERAKKVYGIEIVPEAAIDARANATKNGYSDMEIITGAVDDVIKQGGLESMWAPDVVMVDPPRVGLDPYTLQTFAKLKPKKILYISCNPTTQAQNIGELKKMGYHLDVIHPVDQFPQTVHIENIVVLSLP